ncbi:hypothetical protein ACIQAC_29720 [Streptomyces sp. NPDC088387]|uniref:hypothetical protein n=1 Tax=Streptomyces sp. NPDC088387 TaxID=3365859 RepID=UPI003805E14D
MLPADMGGGGAADLQVSGELLSDFVSRVDAVLRDLEGSAGNPTNVGAQTIKQTSLSSGGAGGFVEATNLYTQYNIVHEQLTSLSKTLHLQIEAIAIAVKGAKDGFDALEESERRRYWQIRVQIDETQGSVKTVHKSEETSGMGG